MPYLVAGLVFVGLLSVFDLVLILAIVRRLRERPAAPPVPFTPPGTPLGEFTATGIDGTAVSRAFFTEPTIVGLFSTTCASCRERLPEFADRARGSAGPVLAVVEGGRDDAEPFVAALSPVAAVVVEPPDGPVAAAFGRPAFPGFYVVGPDAVVTAAALDPSGLPAPART
ncbi:TlpA disulfide reductase family protein [Actinomadura sediminis]|uniref:TlpA disulfide reductase family protein n=1 Tax=Actinomadura sediminis TaxID=1038904 RepID=A0ABW3EGV7_9ACTN